MHAYAQVHICSWNRGFNNSLCVCVCVCVYVYVIVSCLNSAHMTCQGLYANDVLDVLYSSIFVFISIKFDK